MGSQGTTVKRELETGAATRHTAALCAETDFIGVVQKGKATRSRSRR